VKPLLPSYRASILRLSACSRIRPRPITRSCGALSIASLRELFERTRVQETQAIARSIQALGDAVDALNRRFAAFLERVEAAAKADVEAEAAATQAMLDRMPDPENPDAPALYEPAGELHTIHPAEHDAAMPGDPSPPRPIAFMSPP
jgi:hypothetical protein